MKKKLIIFSGVIMFFLITGIIAGIFIYQNSNSLVNGFMTKKQLREDYEFVWDFLENTYPYKNVCIRSGVDLEKIKDKYRRLLYKLEGSYDYLLFYYCMLEEVTNERHFGHLDVGNAYNDSIIDIPDIVVTKNNNALEVKDIEDCDDIKNFNSEIYDVYERAKVDMDFREDAYNLYSKYMDNRKESKKFGYSRHGQLFSSKSISDDIAYIDLKSFQLDWEDSKKIGDYYKNLRETLEKFQDSKHLIIDLRKNIGGYAFLWVNGLIYNLISKPIDYKIPVAVNANNAYYKIYLEDPEINEDKVINQYKLYNKDYYTLTKENFKNFEKLKFAEENKEDRDNFNAIMYDHINVDKSLNPVHFRGKLWVLIGPDTVSAGEMLALFLKNAKLVSGDYEIPVTLIGKRSRGMAFSWPDRIYLKLPNSGLIVKSDLGYVLDSDGNSIAEIGVQPDIENKRMNAYRMCLFLIDKEEDSK